MLVALSPDTRGLVMNETSVYPPSEMSFADRFEFSSDTMLVITVDDTDPNMPVGS